ncbi:hypothetical protein [Streptomyces buecherae]|uniref:hypothetical protein n=1 Tax=Streptomyces buecherae TaxID=2763006 RepID=UPI003651901B
MVREVARRVLADPECVTPSSEAARSNRAGELSPTDHLAVMYGKRAEARPWQPTSLKNILLSEAALGYLMHKHRSVIDQEGNAVRLAPLIWAEKLDAYVDTARVREWPDLRDGLRPGERDHRARCRGASDA